MIRIVPEGPLRGHLSDVQLAGVASGGLVHPDDELHLASCRVCSAAHAELVRVRAEVLIGELAAPSQVLEDGHEFVRDRAGKAARSHGSTQRRRRRVWMALTPSLALAALLLAMVISTPFDAGPDPVDLPDVVRQALIEDSSRGMWHPLVADAEFVELPVLRGPGDAREDLEPALDELEAAVQADPNSVRAQVALIAGFQAAGQGRNARAHLDAALQLHPQDQELQDLGLIQGYHEGKLLAVEFVLRERLMGQPDDDLAKLNLAILLDSRGDDWGHQEATALARQLTESLGDSGMRRRAQSLLH